MTPDEGAPPEERRGSLVPTSLGGRSFALPALTSAHSHAFQRALRGKAQRATRTADGSLHDFWSWRDAMYRLAESLDPESLYAISHVAFSELRAAGVLTVGEFHYVHHASGGTPYGDRTILADTVIRAARDAGLRICLLRVAYARAGMGASPEGAQRRFCDPSPEHVMRDVETLLARHAADPDVRIGVAPHSVRAVPKEWLKELAAFANERDLPLHAHVAEQPREVEECLSETGLRPVELLAEMGALSERFTAVHATHLAPHEPRLLGEAHSAACICATTERDLGDGLPALAPLRDSGVRLCTGVDSHVLTDPFEDVRALETGERTRLQRRITHVPETRTLAEQLWHEGSTNGAIACGFLDAGGHVLVDRDHLSLALVDEPDLVDAVVFSGGPSLVARIERSSPPRR